jgi:hypothetical protein
VNTHHKEHHQYATYNSRPTESKGHWKDRTAEW